MTADKITVPILFGEKEELYTLTVSSEQYERIMSGGKLVRNSLNLL